MYYLIIPVIFIFSLSAHALNCSKYKKSLAGISGCQDKNVHLTFDDGPNTTTTPKIIETLKRQNVPATFFISTHQLEKGNLSRKKEILKDMQSSNFLIASHGHDHNCHDIRYNWKGDFESGYTDEQRRDQVSKSIKLLNKFTDRSFEKQNKTLIRFPYGRGISPSRKEITTMIDQGRHIEGNTYAEQLEYYRAHSPAMSIASEYNLDHIGWNHDSEDSTSKYRSNNKDEYVSSIVKFMCKSSPKNIMSLFHDTRAINSLPSSYNSNNTVMDEIIEKAQCLGVNFVSMDEILDMPLQAGVHTESYNSTDKLSEFINKLGLLEPKTSGPVCSDESNATSSNGRPCTSKYIGEVKHCEGSTSYCIDGQWVKSKKLYEMVCTSNFPSDTAQILSSKYLNKPCIIPSKRSEIQSGVAVCYCQEDIRDNNNLKWQCSDIRSGKAVRIN